MGSSALGTLGLVIENLSAPGRILLYSGSVTATASATVQPSGSTGMRCFVVVQGNTTSGTVTIAGTAPGGGSITETTPTIPAQVAGQPVVVAEFEYATNNVYATINASGITTTGLTNGTLMIYGVQAAKFLIPSMADFEQDFKTFSAQEQRGIYDRDTHIQQLTKEVNISSIKQSLYPEDSLFIGYTCVSQNPTITTIPASPTSLKSAATTSPFSLTIPPTSPGMKLIFVVSGASGFPGTITITNGVNQYGQTVSETITITANGTYYSSNVYSSIPNNGIAVATITGYSINVNGVFGWQYVFTPDSLALASMALEWFTGTDSNAFPYSFFTELQIAHAVDKEVTVDLKGMSQDMEPIGNRATTPLSTSRVVSLAQPTDNPMIGWRTVVDIDQLNGTPLTTPYSQLIDVKIALKIPQNSIFTATNTQLFSSVYRGQREVSFDATVNFVDLVQYEAFRTNLKQYFAIQFLGDYIGSVSNVVYSKSWAWTFPSRYAKFKRDASKLSNVEVSITGTGEYEPAVGYSHSLTVICQQPPTYLS